MQGHGAVSGWTFSPEHSIYVGRCSQGSVGTSVAFMVVPTLQGHDLLGLQCGMRMVGGGDVRATARPPPLPPPPPPPWPAAVGAEQTSESPQGQAAPASEGQGLAALLENVGLWQRQLLELENRGDDGRGHAVDRAPWDRHSNFARRR